MHVVLEAAGYRAVLSDIGASLSSLTAPSSRELVLPAPPQKIREGARAVRFLLRGPIALLVEAIPGRVIAFSYPSTK